MYLSLLTINPESPVARTWLGNPYRVHQRLLLGFPEGLPERLLFRIESDRRPPRLLVQADGPADWAQAFTDHPVLACAPRQKSIEPLFVAGQLLRFRLRANPTKRLSAGCPGQRVDGPRVGLFKESEQRSWLSRRAALAGFEPLEVDLRLLGTVVSRKNPTKSASKQSHLAVEFEGRLRVLDADALAHALRNGVGSGKAYGFGLLSLARG